MYSCLQSQASRFVVPQGRFRERYQREKSTGISRMFGSLIGLGGGEGVGDYFRGFRRQCPPFGNLELVLDLKGLRRSLPGHWYGSQIRIA